MCVDSSLTLAAPVKWATQENPILPLSKQRPREVISVNDGAGSGAGRRGVLVLFWLVQEGG